MALLIALLPTLLPALLSIVSPLVVAGVKRVSPKVPKVLLPLASVAVGTVGAVTVDYITGTQLGPVLGAVSGAVGVAVREVVDQAQKALNAPSA